MADSPTTKVYIAQLLCPNRHCVVAGAGEFENHEDAKALISVLEDQFAIGVATGEFNHECGICKSTKLHVEIGATVFRTMEEAAPALKQSVEAQRATRAFLDSQKN